LEQLAEHDDVEALVVERERLGGVGPDRFDPELGRLCERLPVDVDPDHLVPLDVGARERTQAAAGVEPAAPGTDPFAEDRQALRPAEDEVFGASRLVVGAVHLLDLLESAHAARVPEGRTGKLDQPWQQRKPRRPTLPLPARARPPARRSPATSGAAVR